MRAKKSLGQHSIKCHWVVSTLIKAAEVSKKDIVLEVGPGTGVLTRELAKTAGRVIAVEKDERLAEELKKSLEEGGVKNVEIVTGDILRLLQTTNYKLQTNSYKIVANIPYYLTSRLLRLLLESLNKPNLIALTIQKEVARRIVAKPPHMNLLALSVQSFGKPRIIKDVPADCFFPKPKIDSSIISISDISDDFFQKNKISPDDFFKLLRIGFSQKRKMLRGVLGKKYGREKISAIFSTAKIQSTARPQEISLEQWATLTKSL